MASTVVLRRSIPCTSDTCSLWGALADTDRLNRIVGMRPVEVAPLEGESAARFLVRTNLGGFDVAYEEPPYEWEYLRRFAIERRMRNGPVELLRMAFETHADGLGTRVELELTLAPRSALLGPIVRMSGARSLARMARSIRALDAALGRGELALVGPRSPVDEDELGRALERLRARGVGDVGARLADLLRREADHAVATLRPYALADDWGLPRRDVLAACLVAVREGLLELRWDLICPSCRTGAQSTRSLSELGDHASCQLCELSFGLDLDESVEAVFSPAPAVRRVSTGPFCTGGPARTPHVLSQAVLPPNGEAELRAPREEGRYRLFVRGGATLPIDVRAGGEDRLALDAAGLGWPARAAVAPGGSITIANRRALGSHAKLERAAWARQAASARDVTMLPELRRELSDQLLAPGVSLKVGRVALLFSDLTGSTELYASAGDAAAFRLVLDHFTLLSRVVEARGGTVVKTIGDAVMAAFPTDAAALAAGLDMLRAFEGFRKDDAVRARTHLKVGVFGGPCYAVTANGALDYFGQTVNVAARLQGEARSGELVAPAALVEVAAPAATVLERRAARLKGVPEPIEIARLCVEAPPSSRLRRVG